MSEIQRLHPFGGPNGVRMRPSDDGKYILHSDHLSEVTRLREEVRELNQVVDELTQIKFGTSRQQLAQKDQEQEKN